MKKQGIRSLPPVLLCCMGIAAVSADPAPEGANGAPGVAAAGVEAARIYRDPETGKLGPPPASATALESAPATALSTAMQARLNRSDEGMQARTLPDGTDLVDLQGRFQNFSVVTLDRHGDAHLHCSHSADAIEHTLNRESGAGDHAAGSAP